MISLPNLSSPAGYRGGVGTSQINGSTSGERVLTRAWLLTAGEEPEELLAQAVIGEVVNTEAEEYTSTGKVSAVLSKDENEAVATPPSVEDWSKFKDKARS